MLAKALGIFVFLVLTVLVAILLERKILGRMQMRPGPNRVGPWGLLQSLADGIKLALKEPIIPAGVDKFVYLVAPVISVIPAFMRTGQQLTKGLVEIDDDAVDGAADGLAAVVGRISDGFRQLQTGFARSYALSMLAGAALVVAAILAVQLW